MIVHLLHIVFSFLALSLVFGMLAAMMSPVSGGKITPRLGWALVLGLVAGVTLSVTTQGLTSAKSMLHTPLLAAILLMILLVIGTAFRYAGDLSRTWTRMMAMVLLFLLSILGALTFLKLNAEQVLSSTSVLNTELILNVAALLSGVAILILLAVQTLHMGRALGKRTVLGFLAVTLLLLLVAMSGELTLGLLRLDLLELTPARLSFVAKVAQAAEFGAYIEIVIFAVLCLLFFQLCRRLDPTTLATLESAARRKAKSLELVQKRWFKSSVTVAFGLFGALLYHDLVASRPPTLSPAETVHASAQGSVRIPIDSVADGQLHRFAFITGDGHEVRFFLINKYQDQLKIGVVFDTCMICGDAGYIQEGHQVICVACNVRIFVPSIGRPGGCNPIPLQHEVREGWVEIATEDLDRGAKYFSRIVELEVADPVTGARLINLKAPFKYEFKGKTYFFESDDSYQQFRADPERFISVPAVIKEQEA